MMTRPNGTRWAVVGILLGFSTPSAVAQPPGGTPVLEIRKALLTPAPGFSRTPFGYPGHLTGALLEPPYRFGVYVSDQPFLSEADFEVLEVNVASRALLLVVRLTADGSARMESGVELGEHLATLVNGRLVGAAPIVGYLGTEFPIYMTLRMPRPAAESAAARLRERIPK